MCIRDSNKQDILDIKAILDAHNSDIRIVAKIENQDGVDTIDDILEVADGVMIARGDLGIEGPQERIPGIQRDVYKRQPQSTANRLNRTYSLWNC